MASKSALRAGATFTECRADWQLEAPESAVPLLHKVETAGIFSQVWHYQEARRWRQWRWITLPRIP